MGMRQRDRQTDAVGIKFRDSAELNQTVKITLAQLKTQDRKGSKLSLSLPLFSPPGLPTQVSFHLK